MSNQEPKNNNTIKERIDRLTKALEKCNKEIAEYEKAVKVLTKRAQELDKELKALKYQKKQHGKESSNDQS
jgi:prefoldin subunit 5